ncbi:flavin reductase [Streptomyces sp. SID4928]|uniref:Oxidoreductase n=3 Tax=Streptomyces TaxID=1883 RepID=B1W5N9_STRGG|nr:flavin reductase family protein [Streptomyces griseus]EGE46007.1 flavin reductase domain protein, FMN-binding [Streptomyces sp. ACT-1]MYR09812.1 flavin reductase [Streptomyces sp. SID724]MYR54025.1 flavin reductase [Streptomyces sp. SID4928]MYT76216.1 flavin reductase [Streptomyces sp. SID8364]SBU96079.1 NADH-FMN oxidoreductase RutF, flavin reductase (DIM6/NTAB) family [Streptomyces sp. MnatMP-M77]SCE46386.1 NADH-FMN oxidoreductase RutF, flavin reductase (DIM6/NTAB) family [Streptomyces sp
MRFVSAENTAYRIPMKPSSLRDSMSRFATGVIVLSVGGENIHGMTANAFTSVSLDPPQVLCCVARSAVMHKALMAEKHFAVSILGSEQEQLARYFADKKRPLGPEQYDDLAWEPGIRTRAPLLHGALAWLECELSELHDSGDHSIFIGNVIEASSGAPGPALVFFGGGFQQTGTAGT